MARSLRIQYPHAFYHVIQRGIEKINIFISDNDRKKFLFYLESAHKAYAGILISSEKIRDLSNVKTWPPIKCLIFYQTNIDNHKNIIILKCRRDLCQSTRLT